jgi:hypothetical protein
LLPYERVHQIAAGPVRTRRCPMARRLRGVGPATRTSTTNRHCCRWPHLRLAGWHMNRATSRSRAAVDVGRPTERHPATRRHPTTDWHSRHCPGRPAPAAPILDADLLAGRLSDLGKADPRFHTWLCNGDEIAAGRMNTLLAKSPAGYHASKGETGPRAGRLACRNGAFAAEHRASISKPGVLAGAHDPDLVLHPIA